MEDFHGEPYEDDGADDKRSSLPVVVITLFSAGLSVFATICFFI